MLKSLMLALDGSPSSHAAQELAVDLCLAHQAALCGVGILDTPEIHRPEAVPIGGGAYQQRKEESMLTEAEEKINAFLEDFRQACRKAGIEHSTKRLEGSPHERIDLESHRHDLIVINQDTHFHPPIHDRPGDTLRLLARHTARPILAVPESIADGGNCIMVAYDDSSPAARVLQLHQMLNLYPEQEVHVISIAAHQDKAEALNAPAALFLQEHGRKVRARPIATSARPADVLIEEAESLRPCMLVMGCFGHMGFRERLFGSTTERLLFGQFSTPLFIYH